MNNLRSPAYPVSIGVDEKENAYVSSDDLGLGGFTKLELASLMVNRRKVRFYLHYDYIEIDIVFINIKSSPYFTKQYEFVMEKYDCIIEWTLIAMLGAGKLKCISST